MSKSATTCQPSPDASVPDPPPTVNRLTSNTHTHTHTHTPIYTYISFGRLASAKCGCRLSAHGMAHQFSAPSSESGIVRTRSVVCAPTLTSARHEPSKASSAKPRMQAAGCGLCAHPNGDGTPSLYAAYTRGEFDSSPSSTSLKVCLLPKGRVWTFNTTPPTERTRKGRGEPRRTQTKTRRLEGVGRHRHRRS
jgi:hypothetical protein